MPTLTPLLPLHLRGPVDAQEIAVKITAKAKIYFSLIGNFKLFISLFKFYHLDWIAKVQNAYHTKKVFAKRNINNNQQ